MLCPVLIERDGELAHLGARVEQAAEGRGGLVSLVGEAGVGKSRLTGEVADLARARGFSTLSGRAVAGATAVPYRPLTEAFLGAFRSSEPPKARQLAGFGGQLGRLVPEWRSDASGGADESPVLLGEAVVRLLRILGGDVGCLLVLEDLHWADVETWEVVEYVADALPGEPILCVCTARPEGAVLDTVSRLRRHVGVSALELAPLSPDGVDRAVAACLETDHVPGDVLTCIESNSEGNPFLIEELLAGLVASGLISLDQDQWVTTGLLTPTVPFDFGESITRRLSALDEIDRRVVRAAAVLGRHFDWELVAEVADIDVRVVLDALRAALRAQVVSVEGSGFMFRHALTREAVLGDQLPPERRDLARLAWPAVERAHPGLPGSWCELAAELAEASGEPLAAAVYLVECATRALASGALATAEATASHAKRLAGTDLATGIDADEVSVQVLALAGKVELAAVVGRSLLDRLADAAAADDRRVDLLLVLARAALAGGDATAAAALVDEAGDLVELGGVEDSVVARVEAVGAHVALTENRLDRAEALARSAVQRAAVTAQPEVECEALEVIGRLTNLGGESGRAWFERAADVAERNGLPGWLLRARHELALLDWALLGRIDQLRETRDLAARNGALVTVAVMDLSLADAALVAFDREGCLDAAQRCVDASQRYGLATLPVACLWLAGAYALASRDSDMEAAAEQALKYDPENSRIVGDLWGRVRAARSIVRDDRTQLRADLETMMENVRVAAVGTSIFFNRILWALLRTCEDDDHGAPARAELAAATHLGVLPAFRIARDLIEIVAEGRERPTAELTSRCNDALRQLHDLPTLFGTVQYIQIVVAEAAIRDGWGDPVSWLRQSEAFFSADGYELIARRCRRLLGEAGAPIPRRGRGKSIVPPALRALGITSRELDVLNLVAGGLSNRQISERLYVSRKTVERHVASLFDRTGVRNRQALADFVDPQSQ